jgi:regulator of protease activity HflC (stomatin/prohibitin superfamily)
MPVLVASLLPLIVVVVVLLMIVPRFIRQINQYERGVLFTTGKFSRVVSPGWFVLIPAFQTLRVIDIRTKTIDVPNQEVITKDNIPIQVNAVLYFRVAAAEKAVIEVEDFIYATAQLAQTTMRNVIGEYTLDQLLQERSNVAKLILDIVDKASDPWGIQVQSVELKDIILPDSLKRTIAKAAEAEREKKAVIVASEGEMAAAQNMAQAAATLSNTPGAMQLRTLQTIASAAGSGNNTVWVLPTELTEAIKGIGTRLHG